jgi:hypothetical protein
LKLSTGLGTYRNFTLEIGNQYLVTYTQCYYCVPGREKIFWKHVKFGDSLLVLENDETIEEFKLCEKK